MKLLLPAKYQFSALGSVDSHRQGIPNTDKIARFTYNKYRRNVACLVVFTGYTYNALPAFVTKHNFPMKQQPRCLQE